MPYLCPLPRITYLHNTDHLDSCRESTVRRPGGKAEGQEGGKTALKVKMWSTMSELKREKGEIEKRKKDKVTANESDREICPDPFKS